MDNYTELLDICEGIDICYLKFGKALTVFYQSIVCVNQSVWKFNPSSSPVQLSICRIDQ